MMTFFEEEIINRREYDMISLKTSQLTDIFYVDKWNMAPQVKVSTYFTVSSYCDPLWDVRLVCFEALMEATWDTCHCNVIHLSPGISAFGNPF